MSLHSLSTGATCIVPNTNNPDTQPLYEDAFGTPVLPGDLVFAGDTVTLNCPIVSGRPSIEILTRTCEYDFTTQEFKFGGDHPHSCKCKYKSSSMKLHDCLLLSKLNMLKRTLLFILRKGHLTL